MYTDTSRPNHLAHEVIDNSVDEAHRRPLQADRRHALQGRLARGRRRRPRHAGRHPPEGEGERRRADPHAAARRRQVLRQDLPVLRRPARRRRLGRQRALASIWSAGSSAAARNTTSASRTASSTSKLEVVGTVGQRNTGTTVRFWPDPKFFDSDKFSVPQLKHMLKAKAVLCPGLRVTFKNEASGREGRVVLHRRPRRLPGRGAREGRAPAGRADHRHARPATARWSTGRCAGRRMRRRLIGESYVNLIPTTAGRHARQRPALGRRRGGARVLRVPQPAAARHQAHARGRLGQGLLRAVDQDPRAAVRRPDEGAARLARGRGAGGELRARLAGAVAQPASGRRRAHRAVRDRQRAGARSRPRSAWCASASPAARRCPASSPTAPARSRSARELFLVEGDSAGGSAKQARDKDFQAIMPLRGKILNTWEVDAGRDRRSRRKCTTSASRSASIPARPTCQPLRYHKVCILADADSDGQHIATLLCALFLRHFRPLVAQRARVRRDAAAVPHRCRQAGATTRSTTPSATQVLKRIETEQLARQAHGDALQGPRAR